jgi:hypothetical protein
MNRILVMVFCMLFAGAVGFAVARATSGMEARIAASGAAVAAAESQGCALSARSIWKTGLGEELTVEANSLGAECARAVVVMTIRGADDFVYTRTVVPTQLADFGLDASSREAFATSLAGWIVADNGVLTTDTLPEWTAGAGQPASGDGSVFYPRSGFDRPAYETLRAARAPLFCYRQGPESETCVTLRTGLIAEVGARGS